MTRQQFEVNPNLMYVPIVLTGFNSNDVSLSKHIRSMYDVVINGVTYISYLIKDGNPGDSGVGKINLNLTMGSGTSDALYGSFNPLLNKSFFSSIRPPKVDQMEMINGLRSVKNAKHFIPIGAWRTAEEADTHRNKAQGLIMKPGNSARGMGISRVPKGKTASWFIATINPIIRNKSLSQKEKRAELAKHNIGVSVHNWESSYDESFKFFEEIGDYFELIDEVFGEYRLVTDGDGMPGKIIQRSVAMSESGIYQPAGPSGNIDNLVDFEDCAIVPHFKEEIKRVIAEMKAPISSFDIFIATNPKTGELGWGIFEFSNEFGVQSMDVAWVQDEVDYFIRSIISTHVKNYLAEDAKYKNIEESESSNDTSE